MGSDKIVHVIGTGTIGEPLIGLLADFQDCLGIHKVTFHKRTPLSDERAKVADLIRRGAGLFTDAANIQAFRAMDFEVIGSFEDALAKADVVIDCTSDAGLKNKGTYYEQEDRPLGYIAQGSEDGFGKKYAFGINDAALVHGQDRFVQVVSCNSHNLAVLVHAIALAKNDPENLIDGDFTMMRRATDIGQDTKFIPGIEVGKHDDETYGTHHARDVAGLFATLGYDLPLFSSAAKLPTQYMHAMRFSIHVREALAVQDVLERLHAVPTIALTEKKSSNRVFSFGRDHGHYGRILSQTVVPTRTLSTRALPDGTTKVVGFAFTPQDGNSLLSSVAIATWFLHPESYQEKVACLNDFIFCEV
jgi:glyceraldehyde-3-phosphate dehydrogenase (NAD(P))